MIGFSIAVLLVLLIKESNSLWCFQCSEFGVAGKNCPRNNNKIEEWKLNPVKFEFHDAISGARSCVLGYDLSKLGYYQVNISKVGKNSVYQKY